MSEYSLLFLYTKKEEESCTAELILMKWCESCDETGQNHCGMWAESATAFTVGETTRTSKLCFLYNF